ncbi:MAG: 30S ribosomal protein S5 [Mycoplasma sp.]|nr:30S ribosomal protein S5 [Candidatus Hennigella equi]
MENQEVKTTAPEQPKQEAVKPAAPVAAEAKPADKKPEAKAEGKKPEGKDQKKTFVKKPRQPIDGFSEKVVAIKRISKTTKGGRNMRFSVLVVIGDKKGTVGFGMGKSAEIPNAMKKANKNARNNIAKVTMNKKGTLYHEVIGKSCAAKVLLKPAPEGTGIVAGGAIRAVIELAGFKDVYTKNLGKNTAVNMIRATINGLKAQKTPSYIAQMRDKKVSEL